MVTIGMNYKVIDGKGEAFEKAFNNVLNAMKEIEDHTQSSLYKDVNDALSYLIVSEWTSEEAFKAFIASEQFRNVVSWGKENILAGRPTHTVYQQ
ncbi:MAG: antibiotic biosynthesis monooxygenase family protein [Thermodesulfobacteriota bacterium]